MADPASAAAAMAQLASLFGRGVGAPAPAPNLGGGGLLGGRDLAREIGELSQQGNFGQPLSQSLEEAETFPIGELTTDDIQADDGPGFFGRAKGFGSGFFEGLDAQLQSPSRTLGIGLLNQARPGAGNAALGLMGLLGGIRGAFNA